MSDYDSDALAGFDEFFGGILKGLTPAKRRKATLRLGRALRRANVGRQARNEEPDGSKMEPRKSRKDKRGRLRRKAGGKMFRKLRYASMWKVDARPDSVEVKFTKGDSVIRIHHFGERGFVGRDADGRKVYTKYPERRLLGFGPGDKDEALVIAEEMLGLDQA